MDLAPDPALISPLPEHSMINNNNNNNSLVQHWTYHINNRKQYNPPQYVQLVQLINEELTI